MLRHLRHRLLDRINRIRGRLRRWGFLCWGGSFQSRSLNRRPMRFHARAQPILANAAQSLHCHLQGFCLGRWLALDVCAFTHGQPGRLFPKCPANLCALGFCPAGAGHHKFKLLKPWKNIPLALHAGWHAAPVVNHHRVILHLHRLRDLRHFSPLPSPLFPRFRRSASSQSSFGCIPRSLPLPRLRRHCLFDRINRIHRIGRGFLPIDDGQLLLRSCYVFTHHVFAAGNHALPLSDGVRLVAGNKPPEACHKAGCLLHLRSGQSAGLDSDAFK